MRPPATYNRRVLPSLSSDRRPPVTRIGRQAATYSDSRPWTNSSNQWPAPPIDRFPLMARDGLQSSSLDQRALKVAKRKLGTHKRATKKREEMSNVLCKMSPDDTPWDGAVSKLNNQIASWDTKFETGTKTALLQPFSPIVIAADESERISMVSKWWRACSEFQLVPSRTGPDILEAVAADMDLQCDHGFSTYCPYSTRFPISISSQVMLLLWLLILEAVAADMVFQLLMAYRCVFEWQKLLL